MCTDFTYKPCFYQGFHYLLVETGVNYYSAFFWHQKSIFLKKQTIEKKDKNTPARIILKFVKNRKKECRQKESLKFQNATQIFISD